MEQGITQINNVTVVIAPPIKYCLYARKSTESEERQILSIDSQVKEMLQIAEKGNLHFLSNKSHYYL